jgi:hypothetical protein
MRSTPLYAPDGMAGTRGAPQRFSFDAVQAHERHDDGLVHNHNWAVTADIGAMAGLGETSFIPTFTGSSEAARSRDHGTPQAHDRYDDGLVHNHDWAVTGK